LGDLFNQDAEIFREFFKEQAKLLGIKVKYRYPIDMKFTLHFQEDPLGYSEPIDIDIIFSQSPQLKTLKKLGWVSEDKSDKPYLIQMPYDTPNLQKGSLVILPVPAPLIGSKVFKITDITVDQILPDSWYCKVAPKFEDMDKLTLEDYKDKSYSFLKVDQDAT
jgi:hypothetical protein